MKPDKLKIAIIANEFFDANIAGYGGFGWLAREAALAIEKQYSEAAEVIFLSGAFAENSFTTTTYGIRVIFPDSDWGKYVEKVSAEKIDVILTIDYRPNYDYPIAALPNIPMIFWIQDPRPPEDVAKVNSLKFPGNNLTVPGIDPIDCTSLVEVVRKSEMSARKIIFASPSPELLKKVKGTYGIDLENDSVSFLPYPLNINPGDVVKSEKAIVTFLGRLDPIKRPWLFLDISYHFPHVQFNFMGKAHFTGMESWIPSDLPNNVRFLGHVDGREKHQMLSESWVLINTSIHEALPVSFLEALQYEMPIVSCQNPEKIAEKFGFYTGRYDGDGRESLTKFIEGLEVLLTHTDERIKRGKDGRRWVEQNHTEKNFLRILYQFIEDLPESNANVDLPQPWGLPLELNKTHLTAEDIKQIVPAGETIIMVDENQLPRVDYQGFRIFSFIDNDGKYWGAPEDDQQAILELERLRAKGARYIAITFPTFWWMDYYKGWYQYILKNYNSILQNERIQIFRLN